MQKKIIDAMIVFTIFDSFKKSVILFKYTKKAIFHIIILFHRFNLTTNLYD